MPEAPDLELLKSLPTALDQTLGCMTRIFHLFEGHPAFMGRRSSSMRIAVHDIPGHSQLRTQATSHSSRHERRNPTSTMEKETVLQHHKSYSDISDLAATPSRTFTEFRPSNDDPIEPKPAFSDGTVDALAFYNYESLRAAAMDSRRRSDLDDHREYSKRSSTSPKRLPRARQVHSDSQQSATFPKANTSDHESRNLPRSNSIYARGLEPSELLQWKDGLRSSASPPRRVTNKSPAKLLSHHSSPERRVEPKIKDRGRFPFASGSPKKFYGEAEFKESPGASDFRESLRPFMADAPTRASNCASRLTDLSGDSRDMSVNVIARLMGLEEIPSSISSTKVTKSRSDKFFRGLVQFDPQTMTPPCQSKKHHDINRVQEDQWNYPAQYKMEQGLCCCEDDRRDYEPLRKPFLSFQHEATNKEGLPPNLADAFQAEDAEQGAHLLMKRSTQKKKMVWKILEAMRPKVLLKISRRKQTQPEISKNSAQPIQESKLGTFGPQLSDKEEPARCTSSIKQVQMQDQTQSNNSSTESSIVKAPLEETTVAVEKPADHFILESNARSERVSNADIFQVREVETAESSNSNDKEMCSTGKGTQINNLANAQRKESKSRVVVAPLYTESILESDCETDPSSITQHAKSGNVRESRKTRTTTTRSDSPSPTPDTRRKQGRAASSPEARPSLPRSDHIRGADTVGRKSSLVANGNKKDGRPAAKAQLAKEETLKRRVIDSPVKTSKLRGSNESTHKKETFPIRPAKTRNSQGAVRLKQSNEGAASLPPPKEIRPVTTDPVASNSDVEAQPQPQTSDSKPVIEHLQGPFREAPVRQLSEAQMIERVSADDQCEQSSNSGEYIAVSDEEPQPLLQIQEVAIEELTTPRGDQFNHGKLDDKQAEEMDRPSPVSVLDATPFDEELTLSPTSSSKHNVEPVQDSVATYNDEEHKACQETPATLEANLDMNETEFESEAEPDEDKMFEECFESRDNSVIRNKTKQLEAPGTETMINERLLQSLQSNGILQENDHILLLDCLEEIMERILESQSDLRLCTGLPICEAPKGKQLEQELWLEIQNMKRKTSSSSQDVDICDAVHNLLLQNLLRCQGPQWSTFHTDREKIGLDMETMIVGDLIEEAVGDLCALKKEPLETPRRQLFTD